MDAAGPLVYTALTWCVLLEDEEMLCDLIDIGNGDPDNTSEGGYGPLHAACRRGQVATARQLLGRALASRQRGEDASAGET